MSWIWSYNAVPLEGVEEESCPCNRKFSYRWRWPILSADRQFVLGKYCVGEKVFVKPPGARCTTQWKRGVVTGLPSERSVEVGDILRHVADVRAIPADEAEESDATLPMEEEDEPEELTPRRRRPPRWFDDYVMYVSDLGINVRCDFNFL